MKKRNRQTKKWCIKEKEDERRDQEEEAKVEGQHHQQIGEKC